MSRVHRPKVTAAQISTALKAARAAGQPVRGVRLLPDGSAEVLFGEPEGGPLFNECDLQRDPYAPLTPDAP
jgi:hypothetical protein